jgi:hypothetical protein
MPRSAESTIRLARAAAGRKSPRPRGGQPSPNASARLLERVRAAAAAAGVTPSEWLDAAGAPAR